jgi:hypothetical protein
MVIMRLPFIHTGQDSNTYGWDNQMFQQLCNKTMGGRKNFQINPKNFLREKLKIKLLNTKTKIMYH